jgi:hypothetical protein
MRKMKLKRKRPRLKLDYVESVGIGGSQERTNGSLRRL